MDEKNSIAMRWIQAAIIVVCVMAAFCFSINSSKEYRVRITIPSHYTGSAGEGSDGEPGLTNENVAAERYDMGDLDGNGDEEYLLVTPNKDTPYFDVHITFYFNGKSVYEYDDSLGIYAGAAEYIDLDSDGEKEIFLTFDPYVNSMPLMEYVVLKRTDSGWKALEMIHGETMVDNGFPISCHYKAKEHLIVISCEGTDKQIEYDVTNYYEACINEYQKYDMDIQPITDILDGTMEECDAFGIAAWGVWDISSGTYEDRNCLIAVHGLREPLDSRGDIVGEVTIYFDYNEGGLVHILDMEFRE